MTDSTIRYTDLETLITQFLHQPYQSVSSSTKENILCKKEKNGYGYGSKTFLYRLKQLLGRKRTVDEDTYSAAVMETVKGYASDKSTAIRVFRSLDEYLEKNADIPFHVEYPPVDPGNRFERMMFVTRYLQDPSADISELSDLLWVSERTVDEDIASLRGKNENPVTVNGRSLVMDDFDREDNHIIAQASTVHPVLLMCNLTEVMITLKGLRAMAENPVMKGYALNTASEIWNQLTEYAKNRIHYISEELLGEDTAWLKDLNRTEENPFHTERECSGSYRNSILECLKNGMPCWIEYRSDENSVEIIHADAVTHLNLKHCVTILKDGKEIQLDMNRIIHATNHNEDLY